MSRTIRQRKDDLLNMIKAEKSSIVNLVQSNQAAEEKAKEKKVDRTTIFEEYKKILTSNGIKNEKLINTQLNRMIDANLPKPTIYSNLKFLNLLRSRLTEEGIPLDISENIMVEVEFDMSDINEDDDYIGDVALEFAEWCKLKYDFINNNNKSINDPIIIAGFNQFTIKLPD